MSGRRPPGPLIMMAVLCLFATLVAAPLAVFISSHIHTERSDRAKRLSLIKTIDAEDDKPSRRHRAKHPDKSRHGR